MMQVYQEIGFFGIRFPTTVTGFYERFILYNTNKYEGDINKFGADLSQRIEFQKRSFAEIKAVWESFSDETSKKVEEKSISLKMNIDKRDNPLYTSKGYLLRFISKLAGFGGEREYQKIDIANQFYYSQIGNQYLQFVFKLGKYGVGMIIGIPIIHMKILFRR